MKYSMLVDLTKMSRALADAAGYLRAAPQNDLQAEATEKGRQMLSQIETVLEQHREDLRSETPLEQLAELKTLWESGGEVLEKRLEQFTRNLPKDISYQVRAVFFAEQGEKWDAMGSVYAYMRDDPRFDPVVVLMPIFRSLQRADGHVDQEIIYEDYLTPMGIPFYEYNAYSLPDDRPDLAFTSQPYNSVQLPQFYAESISKDTRLVYLPYFVPDKVAVESVQAWCQLPVYNYAWKVIGSSQRHYEVYRQYSRLKGSNMLITGLPKLDAAATLRERGVPLPEKWENVIRNRKTFLWNSWYSLDVCSLRYFDELLSWFKEHTDCALIWRPHPMTDIVTKLYLPDQYDFWLQCQQRLEELPNAVRDEEVSCDAAFCYSDAQISDYSSLMPQYLLVDKPCLWIVSSAFTFIGEVIDGDWTERASSIQQILDFLERIRQGDDPKADRRKAVRQKDLSLADGHCGERVCKKIWDAMHREDFSIFCSDRSLSI